MPTQHHRSTVTVPTRTPSPTSHTTFKPWNNVHWNMNNVVLKKKIKCLLLEYMYNTHIFIWLICKICDVNPTWKLDPVGSTVRYKMMKLCTGSVQDTMRRWQFVIADTRSVEGIYSFVYCTKWRSGQVSRMPYSLTDNFDRYCYSAPYKV